MIFVQVDLGGGMAARALVDTGSSWALSLSAPLADKLVAKNPRRPSSKTQKQNHGRRRLDA